METQFENGELTSSTEAPVAPAPARFEFRFSIVEMLIAVALFGIWIIVLRKMMIGAEDVQATTETLFCALFAAAFVFIPAYVAIRFDSITNRHRARLSHLRVLLVLHVLAILIVSSLGFLNKWGPLLGHVGLLCLLVMALGTMLRHRVHEHAVSVEDAADDEKTEPVETGHV